MKELRNGVDPEWIKKMRDNPNKKINFTGAHSDDVKKAITELSPSIRQLLEKASENVKFQDYNSQCALNSIANGVTIPPSVYNYLKNQTLDLVEVVTFLTKHGFCIWKLRNLNGNKLSWLIGQRKGVYAVQYGAHCITWNCNTGLLLDSSSGLPHPLRIRKESISLLGIKRIDKIYKLKELGKQISCQSCERMIFHKSISRN